MCNDRLSRTRIPFHFQRILFCFQIDPDFITTRFVHIVYLRLMYFQNLFIALYFPAVTQCLTAKLLQRDSNSSSVCQIISGYNEVEDEGTFSLKYMILGFDKIRVPRMNIGIYEEHAFLITNLGKVSNHHTCAECEASFTKTYNLRKHADVCTRGVTKLVCRGDRVYLPETAHEQAIYGKKANARMAISWMEHEVQLKGMHIHHKMCGHGRVRVRVRKALVTSEKTKKGDG